MIGSVIARGCLLIQAVLWILVYSRAGQWKSTQNVGSRVAKSVSLIICRRNKADHLAKHLPRFLTQSDRSLEIVVVNDNSTDQTGAVLLAMPKSLVTFTTVIAPPKPAH